MPKTPNRLDEAFPTGSIKQIRFRRSDTPFTWSGRRMGSANARRACGRRGHSEETFAAPEPALHQRPPRSRRLVQRLPRAHPVLLKRRFGSLEKGGEGVGERSTSVWPLRPQRGDFCRRRAGATPKSDALEVRAARAEHVVVPDIFTTGRHICWMPVACHGRLSRPPGQARRPDGRSSSPNAS